MIAMPYYSSPGHSRAYILPELPNPLRNAEHQPIMNLTLVLHHRTFRTSIHANILMVFLCNISDYITFIANLNLFNCYILYVIKTIHTLFIINTKHYFTLQNIISHFKTLFHTSKHYFTLQNIISHFKISFQIIWFSKQ